MMAPRRRDDDSDDETRPRLTIGPTEGDADVVLEPEAPPRARRGGDDERIRREVEARIAASSLARDGIEVIVDRREVTLRGTVRDEESRRLAEHIGDSVVGVFRVLNELTLRPPRRRPAA